MRLSEMARRIQPSLTRKLYDMAKEYNNVIDFTLGDPDYETPDYVKRAGCEAIMAGRTKYSENAGMLELREVISARIERETGVYYDPGTEVQVTVGAMEAIFLTLCCLVNPGDEVIIPSPCWINYRHMTEMLGGVPVLVDADEENDFGVAAEAIERAVTGKTVAIILNSPNNPTGAVYDYDTLEHISRVAVDHDIPVIWDECYKSILYDGAQFVSILDFAGMRERAIVINSCSKRFAMTGWRLGYLVGPAELVTQMPKLQENIAACASVPVQCAAIKALGGDDAAPDAMRDGFERRRNMLVEQINAIEKLSVKPPKGTFYALVNSKKTGMTSEAFAYALLQKEQVAVVPGITYGDACEGYIRLAFTMNEDKIGEGIRRIKRFVDSL